MRDLPKNNSSVVKKSQVQDVNKQKCLIYSNNKVTTTLPQEIKTKVTDRERSVTSDEEDILECNSINDNSELSTSETLSSEMEDVDDVDNENDNGENNNNNKINSLEPISEETSSRIQKINEDEGFIHFS